MTNAFKIVKKLCDEGYIAYYAGGCVRDILLGKEPADFDIVTSACPEDVERIFERTVPIGKQFGIIMVIIGKKSYEVATFRKEGAYIDGRRPSFVEFTDEKTDASRRDFTINGMFYDPISQKVIDYVGGREDLERKIVKFIGNSEERIKEDNLRLLRAIRFKVALEFEFDSETFNAVKKHAGLITGVAVERVRDELNKIMADRNRHAGLVEIEKTNLLDYLLPEVSALKDLPQPVQYHKEGDAFTHTVLALESLPIHAAPHIAWAVLFHDTGKAVTLGENEKRITFYGHAKASADIATTVMQRLRFPNYEIKEIAWLIENHMRIADINKMRPQKRYNFLLNVWFNDLIKLAKADAQGTVPKNISFISGLEKSLADAKEWKEKKKHLAQMKLLTGNDLIELGLKPSHRFQVILNNVENLKYDGKLKNKHEAISYVKQNYL